MTSHKPVINDTALDFQLNRLCKKYGFTYQGYASGLLGGVYVAARGGPIPCVIRACNPYHLVERVREAKLDDARFGGVDTHKAAREAAKRDLYGRA